MFQCRISNTIKKLSCIDGLIFMNQKKKISLKDNVRFKAVLRSKLLNDVLYLKENDSPYHDITIVLSEVCNNLLVFI